MRARSERARWWRGVVASRGAMRAVARPRGVATPGRAAPRSRSSLRRARGVARRPRRRRAALLRRRLARPAASLREPAARARGRADARPGAAEPELLAAPGEAQRGPHGRAGSASRAAKARATVALIGDSHAQHWRSALGGRGQTTPLARRSDLSVAAVHVLDRDHRRRAAVRRASARAGTPTSSASLAAQPADPDDLHRRQGAPVRQAGAADRPPTQARVAGYKGRWRDAAAVGAQRDRHPRRPRRATSRPRTASAARWPATGRSTRACRVPRERALTPDPALRRRPRRRRARDRPHAPVLRRPLVLPGDRRRARAQGRRPPDAGVRAHARPVPGPRLRRLDDQQHARADRHERRGDPLGRRRRARRTRRAPWRARACCRRRAGRSGAATRIRSGQ